MATGRIDGRTDGRRRHCRRQVVSRDGRGVAYEARGYKQAGQMDGRADMQADGPNHA